MWTDYEWLVVVGALLSFAMAWGIGANDVANSFGTSVGAKTITLWQACIIAAIFEFVGAIALGGEVTKTIAGSIARPTAFYQDPELFAYGMVCALAAASTWVYCATYMSLAVSTTHSIIGAVIGFALVWQGKDAVVWNDRKKEFPFSSGLVPVICSWFVSPICSAIVSAFLFLVNRTFVLRRENSTSIAIWTFPVLVVVTVFINVFFVLFKGAKNQLKWDANKSAWVSAIVAAIVFVIATAVGVPGLRWKLKRDLQRATDAENAKANGETGQEQVELEVEPEGKMARVLFKVKKALLHGVTKDIHKDVEHSQAVHDMHAAAEVFSPETEHVYKYLQVFSACAVSFAHGANDVANAVGPFAGIWYVYRNMAVSSSAETPVWILAMGGAGIVVGLATYGYNIMATLGVGMAKMTPSRGFCAELATSFTVALSSVYGLPISTTQCIVGAEVGVGVCEGARGTNWMLFLKTVLAWIFTIFVSALLCAAFFSAGAFAPSITMSKDILKYETQIRALSEALYKDLNGTNFALKGAFLDAPFDASLNGTVNGKLSGFKSLYDTKKTGYISPDALLKELSSAIATYKNYSVVATGFNPKTRAYSAPGAELSANKLTVDPFKAEELKKK